MPDRSEVTFDACPTYAPNTGPCVLPDGHAGDHQFRPLVEGHFGKHDSDCALCNQWREAVRVTESPEPTLQVCPRSVELSGVEQVCWYDVDGACIRCDGRQSPEPAFEDIPAGEEGGWRCAEPECLERATKLRRYSDSGRHGVCDRHERWTYGMEAEASESPLPTDDCAKHGREGCGWRDAAQRLERELDELRAALRGMVRAHVEGEPAYRKAIGVLAEIAGREEEAKAND